MRKDADYWLNLASYDIETAKAMLSSGRFLYVLFTCQQALEKTLKALIIESTGKFPPRIHDLLKLTRLAKLDVSTEQAETLSRLSFYYLETRYPEQIADMANNINKEIAGDYLTRSQELLKWLRNKLSLET